MKIYTGNFGNEKKYRAAGFQVISIARFNRWYSGLKMLELAPPADMIHDEEKVYTPKFEQILSKLSPLEIAKRLELLSEGKDVVLLCYEKEGEFCHRHLVADWLSKALSIDIVELGKMENTLF